ncbi:hypothetical protein [Streptomyces sp. NPDC005805]|uniref:hypothetical protein n=1 Tax=Streptomyces sp. NPDC005805 TaxID=3157068 RepID=UPI0034000834
MSFGQGGPQWGSGGQQQDPYGQGPYGQGNDPYGQGSYDDDRSRYGGSQGRYGSDPGTPDWAALADASAARTRRRRWLMVGGGGLATALIAGAVATAIVSSNKDNGGTTASGENSTLPTAPTLPQDTTQPQPSFSSVAPLPPPNPKDFVSDRKKDTAPLSADTLFPGAKLTMGNGERVYTKGLTTRTGNCASVTTGALGGVLERNGCEQVFRATYLRDGIAVTVGVATFENEKTAKKVVQEARGGVAPLPGKGVSGFCKGGPVCRNTYNSYGRYAYFTLTGYTTAKSVTSKDTAAYRTGDDIGEFAFRQIVRRGEAQASAAATAPAG